MKFGRRLIPWLLVLALAAGLVGFGYRKVMLAVYPQKYKELVETYSQQNGLDPMLVYAVIKCESGFDPEINIRYGTLLLSLHKAEFASDELALAAYHAGRGSVNKWLADDTYTDDGTSLHTVPYADTDAYIEKVMKTKETYTKLYGKDA